MIILKEILLFFAGLAQIVPKSNLWVKLWLKIFVKFCEKSIFERIFKVSLKWAELEAQKPELQARAYKLRNNQNWALSSAQLKAQRSSQLAYAIH